MHASMSFACLLKPVAAAMALAVAAPALPQGGGAQAGAGKPVAILEQLEGNVLVSHQSGLASANPSARLAGGTRVITTANSRATGRFDDGGVVTLRENQRLEIDAGAPCRERIARVHSIFAEPAGIAIAAGSAGAAGGAAAAMLGSGAVGVGLAGLGGLAALATARHETTVSPN